MAILAHFRHFDRVDQAVIRTALLHLAQHCRDAATHDNPDLPNAARYLATCAKAQALADLIPAEPVEYNGLSNTLPGESG